MLDQAETYTAGRKVTIAGTTYNPGDPVPLEVIAKIRSHQVLISNKTLIVKRPGPPPATAVPPKRPVEAQEDPTEQPETDLAPETQATPNTVHKPRQTRRSKQ